jgi:3-keto-disaccharide hydrolase
MRKLFRLIVLTIVITSVLAPLGGRGQDGRGQGGRGQGGGLGRGAQPVAYDDYTGYVKLWDGQTFNGWEGETDVWSIDNGAIHADTTKTPGQHHIHYIGSGAIMKDFDLKVEFRISEMGANGGIQYRSRLLHPAHGGSIENPLGKALPAGITTLAKAIAAGVTSAPAGGGQAPNPWQVSGYQFDLDSGNRYTGQLYEGQGRGIVNPPGGVVQLLPDGRNIRIGTAVEDPLKFVKPHKGLAGEWQQVQVVARGNTLVHIINGQVITVSIDDNPTAHANQGILSLQLEGSGQIWYRNVYVKQLEK